MLLMAFPIFGTANTIDSLRQAISRSTGDAKEIALDELRSELQAQGRGEEAVALMDEWAAYEREQGDVTREGKARWGKMALLNNLNLDEAFLAEAPVQMAWFEKHCFWEYYYSTWDSKASIYLYSGKAQTAIHEAELMLHDAQQRNNDYGRVVSYQLSGIAYQSLNQNDAAIENLLHAYELLRDDKHQPSFLALCDYLTQTYDANKNYQEELNLTDEWMQVITEMRASSANNGENYLVGTESSCHIQRSCALMGLGHLNEAEAELQLARNCLKHFNMPLTQYRVHICRARLFMEEGLFGQALASLDSIKQMGVEVGGGIDYLRGKCLMETGNYKEAARLFLEQYELQDSLFGQEMRLQLSELSTLHKIDEREMKARLERNRYLIIIAFIMLAALAAFLLLRHYAARKLRKTNAMLEQKNEELKRANQQVEDSAKMKMDFIKSMSHEIRTPLNILSGFTQIITSSHADLSKNQLADMQKRIDDSTERIVKLVDKMLEMSEANSHSVIERTDTVKAGDIVKEAVRQSRISSTDKVAFKWDSDSSDLASTIISTNLSNAAKALSCLLDNAQKFTKEGAITVSLQNNDNDICFVVEDTGIGVPTEEAEHIFEEFVQIDNYIDGAGMGLTVARSIARRLGGDIRLDTTYTPGARFVMSLPIGNDSETA